VGIGVALLGLHTLFLTSIPPPRFRGAKDRRCFLCPRDSSCAGVPSAVPLTLLLSTALRAGEMRERKKSLKRSHRIKRGFPFSCHCVPYLGLSGELFQGGEDRIDGSALRHEIVISQVISTTKCHHERYHGQIDTLYWQS
jgi:hypothetical protein